MALPLDAPQGRGYNQSVATTKAWLQPKLSHCLPSGKVDRQRANDYIRPVHLPLAAAVFVLLCAVMHAQTPAVPPAPAGASLPAAGTDEMVKLQFPNGADVREVLAFYERLTGKRLVSDTTVQGPITIVVPTPIPRDEAVRIIETSLLLNGFSLVPSGGNIVKVISPAKNPRSTGVPIFSDLDQLPDNDRVVTFLFKLRYADPVELAQVLQTGYIAPSMYTSLVPLPKASALLVTESTAIIRGLESIISQIDVPPAEVVSEFIVLERADVKDVIEKLEKIFEKQPSQAGGAGVNRVAQAVNPAANPPNAGAPLSIEIQPGTLSEESIIVGKIRLTADVRTNRIHVVTRPVNLPFIRKLIHEFDSNIPFGEPAKRPLKFVSATQILDIIVKSITEPGTKAEDAAANAGGSAPRAQSASSGGGASFGGGSSFGGSSGGGSGSLNFQEGLSTEPVDTTPKAVTVGNTKIIADPRENTIIVLGSKEMRGKVFALLDEIDVRAPQVLLNTIIGEMTLNSDREIGFNYFLGDSVARRSTAAASPGGSPGTTTTSSGRNGINISSGTPALDLNSIFNAKKIAAGTSFITGGATGLQGLVFAGDSIGALVNALESTGRFRVTQRPVIFTSNNKKAIIASGQEIAVPTTTQSSVIDSNGAAINNNLALNSNIGFKTVALQLEVVPLINSDREVALDILQKVDDVAGTTRIGGNDVPNISTRYIKTNVSVPNRSTVLLGGLIRNSNNLNDAGVPYISRVPLIGFFFKNNKKTKERRELVVLIQPVVSETPFETVDNSETEQKRLMIQPDINTTIGEPPPIRRAVEFRSETTTTTTEK